MKLSDEFEDQEINNKLPVIYMVLALITVLGIIVCIVLAANQSKKPESIYKKPQELIVDEEPILEPDAGEYKLTSDQLDFWNMYKDDDHKSPIVSQNSMSREKQFEKRAQDLIKEEEEREKAEDLSEGGTKTKVIRPDGTEQWVMVNAYLFKNNYDELGFVYEEPQMSYFHDAKKQSTMGVFLDENTSVLDYEAMKTDGVSFIMARLGYRGYESGKLSLDSKFFDHLQKAEENDLLAGVYFESQAVTQEEALEEAEFVVNNLVEMHITYPVVISMGTVSMDNTRVDNVPKAVLTDVANTFAKRIKESGFTPMLLADKYWLLRRLDLTMLSPDMEVFLDQEGEKPDYPYTFSMWEYGYDQKIKGISDDVDVCISFIDYMKR